MADRRDRQQSVDGGEGQVCPQMRTGAQDPIAVRLKVYFVDGLRRRIDGDADDL